MRFLPRSLRNILLSAAVLLEAVALAACGDWCFSGVINNPNGVTFTSKNASSLPACPSSPIISTMNVALVKSPICETCTASTQAEHVFVAIKSIQLHSTSPDSADTTEWIDLAPQIRLQPRQIDLIGDPTPFILVRNALVPAGTYSEVRLQFAPDTSTNSGDALPTESSCGRNRGNCLLMANGNIEQLDFAADPPELLVPLQINGSHSLAVVPGSTLELRLSLQPRQVASVSASQGWQVHFTLTGSASIFR
jgi:Domain of unknown function (DUF4382)